MKGKRGGGSGQGGGTFSPILEVPEVFSSDMRTDAFERAPRTTLRVYDSDAGNSSSHSLTIEMPDEDSAELRKMSIRLPPAEAGKLAPMAAAGASHLYRHQPFISGMLCGMMACTLLGLLPVLVLIGTLAQNKEAAAVRVPAPAGGVVGDPWAAFTVSAPAGLGVVATDNAVCSEVGVSLLRRGGNAVDAAVGSALCLGVLSPASSGLGGGCYIVWHNASTTKTRFLDARETAGAHATPDMFAADPLAAQDGGRAVAVLGELHGLHSLWQRGASGKLAWRDVVQPASNLARRWQVSAEVASSIASVAPYLLSGRYPELARLYLRSDGRLKCEGDVVENPALADTLQHIGEQGPAYLYDTMAATLAAEVRAAGGLLTEADIRGYASEEAAPISTSALGYRLITAAGSSSGGAVLAGIVKLVAGYPEPAVSEGEALYGHRLVEACKHAFAVRLNLGDPRFVNSSAAIAALLSDDYLAALRRASSDGGVLPLSSYGGAFNMLRPGSAGALREDHGTTHLSVLDRWGNAVALTSTINTIFGSKVASRSTGIVFNNQMDDFSVPGAPNYFGLHPSPLNYPQPGKRPLSSMSPCIVFRSGAGGAGGTEALRFVGGASGGPRIITATAQVLLNVLARGMGLAGAMRAPRLHSQLLPDTVYVEDQQLACGLAIRAPPSASAALRSRGHNTTDCAGSMGVAQFIAVDSDSGEAFAASDPRKGGAPSREA